MDQPEVALLYVDDDYGAGLQGAFSAELFRIRGRMPALTVKFARRTPAR